MRCRRDKSMHRNVGTTKMATVNERQTKSKQRWHTHKNSTFSLSPSLSCTISRGNGSIQSSQTHKETRAHTRTHISQTTTYDDGRGIVAIIECRVREFMRKMISSTSDDGTTKMCLCLALRFVCLRFCLCAKRERGKQHLNGKISPSSFTLCTQTGIQSHTSTDPVTRTNELCVLCDET